MVLDDQIAAVVNTSRLSSWRSDPEIDAQVAHLFIVYHVQTTGGRWLLLQAACSLVVGTEELLMNPTQHEALYDMKRTEAQISLRHLLTEQFQTRTGLKGHRGYFKLVALKPYDRQAGWK